MNLCNAAWCGVGGGAQHGVGKQQRGRAFLSVPGQPVGWVRNYSQALIFGPESSAGQAGAIAETWRQLVDPKKPLGMQCQLME